MANYEALSALPSYTPNTVVGAGFTNPGQVTADQTEGMLDFERAYGTAPGAPIDFLIAQNWLNGTTTQNLLLYAVNTLNDPIMSLSFGSCEALQTSSALATENSTFSQAAAQGQSVFISSGDSGVAGCDGLSGTTTAQAQQVSISDYCASPYITCVGATEFNDTTSPSTYWAGTNSTSGFSSALSYIPEGGWNDPLKTTSTYQAASSGGGVSTTQAKPSYQVGTGVPADGHRDVPDISFSGSVHNAYIVCQASATTAGSTSTGCNSPGTTSFSALLVGGTSASAPSMAGVAALIDQRLGGRQGNMNPLLYKIFASTPASFHDATIASSGVSGCAAATPSLCDNSVPSSTAALTPAIPGYLLQTGYDLVTGLGSLDVNAFLNAAGLPIPTAVITSNPAAPTIFQSVQLSITVTAPAGKNGIPTGTVQFFQNGTALGGLLTLAGGTATLPAQTFMPAATYSITAVYSGDANFGTLTTPAYLLVVTNPNAIPSSSSLTATPAPASTTQTVTLVATVKGSGSAVPTGTVTFYDNGKQTGSVITLNSSAMAAYTAGTLTAITHNFTCLYSGDVVYAASSCAAVTDVVSSVASGTVASLNPASTTQNAGSALSFVVSGASGTPTGSVTAYAAQLTPVSVGSQVVGTVTLSSGIAGGNLTGFTPGTYSLYGVYSGDGTYGSSTSNSVTLTVVGFGMTSNPAALSFTGGATTGNAVTVTYTSISGFSGTITQSCSITPTNGVPVPIAPSCTASPASVSLTGASATGTVTVGTSVATSSLSPYQPFRNGALGGVSFAALFLFVLPTRRRVLRSWKALSLLVCLSVGLLTAVGCSGSSGSGVATGTTKGAYTLVINASASGQTSSTTTSVTIN